MSSALRQVVRVLHELGDEREEHDKEVAQRATEMEMYQKGRSTKTNIFSEASPQPGKESSPRGARTELREVDEIDTQIS